MINIAIIGLGYWGPNLLRNFTSNKRCNVLSVCEKNTSIINKFINEHKDIIFTTSLDEILNDKNIDAIVIATPISTHYKIAFASLKKGKHVFIEKPLADSVKKCESLIFLAKQNSLCLFVDHTFLYTEAVNKIKTISSKKDFGDMLYYDSTRINLGLIQNDVNVMWDLAVHDLAILNFIMNDKPKIVSAIGHKHFTSKPITTAYLTVKYNSNFIAHVNVNWLSPVKIRQTIVAGSKKMIVYNDLEPSDKLSVYDKGVDVIINNKSNSDNLINYKIGDTTMPNLKNNEALALAVDEFIKSIYSGLPPLTDGLSGLNVVKILEAANKSLNKNGKPILI